MSDMGYTELKLVRERVPERMRAEGQDVEVCQLGEREYRSALRSCLSEAVRDFLMRPDLERLAELQDLLDAVRKAQGFTRKQLDEARRQLKEQLGGYEARTGVIFPEEL